MLDAAASGDTIVFDPTLAGMTITLASTDARTTGAGAAIPVGSTALVLDGGRTITIDGSAAPGLVISGNDARRIFVVSGATTVLELVNLTLSGGRAAGGHGGDAETGGGGGGGAGLGGAIYVDGATVRMVGCLVTECVAFGGGGGMMSPLGFGNSSGGGGGLGSDGAGAAGANGGSGGDPNPGTGGAPSPSAATGPGGGGGGGGDDGGGGAAGAAGGVGGGGGGGGFAGGGAGGLGGGGGGSSTGPGGAGGLFAGAGGMGGNGGGGAGLGGGVFLNGGALEATNCTFAFCSATGGSSAMNLGEGRGGAIFQRNGSLALMHCTIARSGATTTAGGVGVVGDGATATVSIRNTIIESATTALEGTTNAGGTISDSGGGNVITSQTGFSPVPTVSTADPLVALVLAANGGPTQTLSLLFGSPAVNAADATVQVNAPPAGPGGVDQRGLARRSGFTDVGAFEAQVDAIVAQSGGGQSALVSAAFADPIVLRADDANGNALAGAPLTIAPPASGATAVISSLTPTTGASGTAQVTATANATVGGPYTVNVTSGTGAGVFQLTNTAPPPAAIALVSGGGQSAEVGTAFAQPVVLRADDAGGNPLEGVTITITPPASGASATFPATVQTDVNGLASLSPTANAVAGGPYTVNVSAGSVTGSFELTNLAPPATPAAIVLVSGGGQSAEVGAAFAQAIVLRVDDAGGTPLAGVTITITPPASGASATFPATVQTDVNGLASLTPTANAVVGGPYTVNVSASAGSVTGAFELTNTAGAPARIVLVSGGNQRVRGPARFPGPIIIAVHDAHGNLVPNVTVTLSTSSPLVTISPPSASTDAIGQVAFVVEATRKTDNDQLIRLFASVVGVPDRALVHLSV